jgi:hypothetical protein
MSENKQKWQIKHSVEFNYGGSAFKLDLDECGLPQFPESVREKLPPYVPEMVEKLVRYRKNGYLRVIHESWCAETAGLGMCNCNPVMNDPTETHGWASGDGKLTCSMCYECSFGEIGCQLVEDTVGNCWELLWTKGGDRFYWIMEKDESKLILCEDCLKYAIEEILKELEKEGHIKSFVDSDGKRSYILPEHLQ